MKQELCFMIVHEVCCCDHDHHDFDFHASIKLHKLHICAKVCKQKNAATGKSAPSSQHIDGLSIMVGWV